MQRRSMTVSYRGATTSNHANIHLLPSIGSCPNVLALRAGGWETLNPSWASWFCCAESRRWCLESPVVKVWGGSKVCVSSPSDSLQESFVACEQSLRSLLVVARRSSFRALFPASEGSSHTWSLLPCQRSFSERLPETILPSSSHGAGLHLLAVVPSVGRCRIGNAEAGLFRSIPSVSRIVRLNAAQGLVLLRSGLSAQGYRQRLGLRARLTREKTVAHF